MIQGFSWTDRLVNLEQRLILLEENVRSQLQKLNSLHDSLVVVLDRLNMRNIDDRK